MKNKYIKHTKISEAQFRTVLKLFCLDMEASKSAQFVGLSRITINRIYDQLRERIARLCEADSPFAEGEIELGGDNSSDTPAFRETGARVRRGASGRTPLFGIIKQGDKIYTQVIRNGSASQLLPIIRGEAGAPAWCYEAYDGLADFGCKKFYRIRHSSPAAGGQNRLDTTENFWGVCKTRLSKSRGIHRHKFYLHIKECEFRYNHRDQNIYLILLRNFRNNPMFLT